MKGLANPLGLQGLHFALKEGDWIEIETPNGNARLTYQGKSSANSEIRVTLSAPKEVKFLTSKKAREEPKTGGTTNEC